MRSWLGLILALALANCGPPPAPTRAYDVVEKSIDQISLDLAAGAVTSEALVTAYLNRIDAIDRDGPTLRSIIALNPKAIEEAQALDAERKAGKVRGPLHGVPILVKDNIETLDHVPTTAGSLALKDNLTGRDAPAIARLRAAGAIILGKTNLSEWANIRSRASISGWSAVGGLTRNPYALDRNPCGSSSGSGAAAAASLAGGAIGTETDGSITCPSAVNGLVGVKPTVGLVSRTHIVPISHSQDTAGPMTRTVRDAAILLTAMAGSDPLDPATAEADARKVNYVAQLSSESLKGKRIGVLRFLAGYSPALDDRFNASLETLRKAGATLVEINAFPALSEIGEAELMVLLTELKAGLNAYLASSAKAVKTRSLAEVIAFNKETAAETALFGQDLFERAEATAGLADPAYLEALARIQRLAGPEGIDRLMLENNVEALVAPTMPPAWTTDLVNGDMIAGGATTLSAVAGYPHVTVPMGTVRGLPVGLSFMGEKWSEAKLLSLAYAFETLAKARTPPSYAETTDQLPGFTPALVGAR